MLSGSCFKRGRGWGRAGIRHTLPSGGCRPCPERGRMFSTPRHHSRPDPQTSRTARRSHRHRHRLRLRLRSHPRTAHRSHRHRLRFRLRHRPQLANRHRSHRPLPPPPPPPTVSPTRTAHRSSRPLPPPPPPTSTREPLAAVTATGRSLASRACRSVPASRAPHLSCPRRTIPFLRRAMRIRVPGSSCMFA